jgi:copper(I)-binding protein
MSFTLRSRRQALLGLSTSVLSVVLSGPARAHGHGVKQGDLTIEEPWSAATPPGARTAAVYFDGIQNRGQQADQLLGGRSSVCESVEIHEMTMDGSVMRMRALPSVELPAGQTLRWGRGSPRGLHVMLIGLKSALKEGESFPLTLKFKQAGDVEFKVLVRSAKAQAASGAHKH